MKIYRRIKITAFRRQDLIVSGDDRLPEGSEVTENNTQFEEMVDIGTDEEQKVLVDAARRLLEENAPSSQ